MDKLKYKNQGAHLYYWKPLTQQESVLFCSEQALFDKGKAIRGGVPICWPWFGPKEGKTQHGFARIAEWKLIHNTLRGNIRKVLFTLESSAETKLIFPFDFEVSFNILESETYLKLTLTTKNNDEIPFPISPALHSYFAVGDIDKVKIEGFQNATYIDKVDNGIAKLQHEDFLKINQETDRIYLSSDTNKIFDYSLNRIINIKHNSTAIVVWNPWQEKCRDIGDMADEEYMKFVCIESAIMPEPYVLLPGETHTLEQIIMVQNM